MEIDKMPYIKKIEVNGFKTFGRKTTLVFGKGFTAITGPNGSGKTNVIDAVLFCLGELRSRRLRSTNFSSLIFHGSQNQDIRKKNKAKVIIQFDNSDGHLPTDTNTVSVSREIDQNGQSVYRINGRRVSRSYLIEVLSIAGISPYGHNVILQGALTRMADVSSHERKKVIEELIGIAHYDTEKSEAEDKLKSANITIKTAFGKVGEVQKRIESLERERNDFLRYKFIQQEINHLERINISYEINNTQNKINDILTEIKSLKKNLDDIKTQRNDLRLKRHKFEIEWRNLGFKSVEESRIPIIQIQMKIGELQARNDMLDSKINTEKTNLDDFIRTKGKTSKQVLILKNQIEKAQKRVELLKKEKDNLSVEIKKRESNYKEYNNETNRVRSYLEEHNIKIREQEEIFNQLNQKSIKLRSEYAEGQSRIKIYSERLNNLETKRSDFDTSLERLEESFNNLKFFHSEQYKQLKTYQDILDKGLKRKKKLELEIVEAGKIANIAREAFVEFETRKGIVDKFKTEKVALNHLEELGKLGIIKGIHGQLKNLITIKRDYKRAVEAAACGWLESLVVQDLNVAYTCVETLRKLKLGRIKIIPLEGLSINKQVNHPKTDGILNKVSSFVRDTKKYAPAVYFVLGDTLLVSNEKDALNVSRKGYRSVTLDGDLYEVGGGFESGFYRMPFDFSTFVPSQSALKSLDKAVTLLKDSIIQRQNDVQASKNEISEAQSKITNSSKSLIRIESQIERAKKSINHIEVNIRYAESNIEKLRKFLEVEEKNISLLDNKKEEIIKKELIIKELLKSLKKETDFSKIQEGEQRREALGNEIIKFNKEISKIDTELSTLQVKIGDFLNIRLENSFDKEKNLSKQIEILKKDINESLQEKKNIQKKINEHQIRKDNLDSLLLNEKEEVKKFTANIDEIDSHLQLLESKYEENDKILDELRLNLQTFQLKMGSYIEQLKALGLEEPLNVKSKMIQETKDLIKSMRIELEYIGAVNQLAQSQYKDQISRYKQLSLRMNELEKERMAILSFIDGIEQKKYNAFMEAFNRTNKKFQLFFSKLTGGGFATLQLENPDNPLLGGVDMVVQFIGKPQILVSGASSGERSVSAVAFLFALQEFTPASFYLLDEIDAHLDAFHVERLGELLAQESDRSQFVVVTLKPEMVSKADRIYGVYLRGVSQVVSTSFKGV
jgi:chromosome segregation protein